MTTEAMYATSSPVMVQPRQITRMALFVDGDALPDVDAREDGIPFLRPGWFEVLLTVEWDPQVTDGRRFAHTKIPDQHPLHSEVIDADALTAISGGRQLLRGNSVFGPDGLDCIQLEVWHDGAEPVEVRRAELLVRRLVA